MNVRPGGRESAEEQYKRLFNEQVRLMEKFERMMLTDGWKEFAAFLEREIKLGEDAMLRVTTGDDALRTNTSLQTVRRILNLPIQHVLNTRKELDEQASQGGSSAQKP